MIVAVTIRIDGAVLDWFKDAGKGYQSRKIISGPSSI